MNIATTPLLAAVLLALPVLSSLAAPANDDFADAYQLSNNFGTISGSNDDASYEDDEPYHAGNSGGASVWYFWKAPRQGRYRFDTLGSNFDTLLGIYTGSAVDDLSLIAENDQDGTRSTSSTVFRARRGTEYEIAVDGYNDGNGVEVGDLQLTWEQINPPQADFNGDDRNDFLLFAPSTGRITYRFLKDNASSGTRRGPTVPEPYEVSDTGDFNLDENPDLVLRNVNNNRTVIWVLKQGRFSAAYHAPTLPANYYLAAVDDFNDDGEEDYLIAHRSNGRTAIWNLDNGTFLSASNGPKLPRGWEVAGAADLNVDGNPDIVIYQKATGKTAFWLWNGRKVTSTLRGPTVPAGYRLTGVGDYNRDGLADLVLVAPRSGRTVFWTMNRNRFSSSKYGPSIPAGFGLAAPR